MSHDEAGEDRAIDALGAAARGLAGRELDGAGPRPDFAEIVARAHRIDPKAVPHGWIDAARRGAPVRPTRQVRRGPGVALVIAIAAALVLALALKQGLGQRVAGAPPGSLAGLLGGAEGARPASAAARPGCPEGQVGCEQVGVVACREGQVGCGATCPEGQVGCGATCPEGQVGCGATCPEGQVGCGATCPEGQVGCGATCPEGQVCSASCAEGQAKCERGGCPEGQVCSASCAEGKARCEGPGCPEGQVGYGAVAAPVLRRPRARGEGVDERLRRLDDEAEALRRAGDLAGADERYVEIAAIGGSRPAVEHAFVDRFGLARARQDVASQRRLWRAYLERFPRGSFADDARAGLCRSEAGAGRAGCWDTYLAEFPAGAHRDEAAQVRP